MLRGQLSRIGNWEWDTSPRAVQFLQQTASRATSLLGSATKVLVHIHALWIQANRSIVIAVLDVLHSAQQLRTHDLSRVCEPPPQQLL
jgi:hypothetical protein